IRSSVGAGRQRNKRPGKIVELALRFAALVDLQAFPCLDAPQLGMGAASARARCQQAVAAWQVRRAEVVAAVACRLYPVAVHLPDAELPIAPGKGGTDGARGVTRMPDGQVGSHHLARVERLPALLGEQRPLLGVPQAQAALDVSLLLVPVD